MTRKHTALTPEAFAAMGIHKDDPNAWKSIRFDPLTRRIELIHKTNGHEFFLPISMLEEFDGASDSDLESLRLSPAGDTIISDGLDLHVGIEGFLV